MSISRTKFIRAITAWTLLGVAAIPHAARAQTKAVFDYTGANQAFVVPAGVTSLTVKLWGAGGGYGGGSGAFVTGLLSVTPGATLTLLVGGGGGTVTSQGGFGGGGDGDSVYGGGGGRSAIRNGGVELVTAGGGGGDIGGGAGGLVTGGNGSSGFGGGQFAGGAGGNGGADGSQFIGGSGSVGGGGGGGWFGGGGGGGDSSGGGGSSFLDNLTAAGASEAGSTGDVNSGVVPGGTSDSDYVTGIGRGGNSLINGGDGRIVLVYTTASAPEPRSLALLALGGVGLLAQRKRKQRPQRNSDR